MGEAVRESRWSRLAPYSYVAPFFLLFFVFGLVPMLSTFYISLFDWDPIGPKIFVGLENFARLWADERFWNALVNTVGVFALATVPQLIVAVLLAHVLNNARLRAAGFFRMAMLVPYITSVAATAIVFAQIVDKDYGLLNWMLGVAGLPPLNLLASQFGSWIVVAAMVAWRWFGYTTLLYLAALQAMPREVYDSAAVDGASGWRLVRHITVPSLRPMIVFTVLTSTIGGLQIFTEPMLLQPDAAVTCGPARQCQTVALFIYEEAFTHYEFGYGSAIGVVLFVVIVLASLLAFVLTGSRRRA